MKLNTVCGNIIEREIVLYGDSEEIGNFLERYQSVLKIKAVITDHKKEVKLQSYMVAGVKTILVEDMVFEEELIIVCDRTRFGTLLRRLKHLGKVEYRDFISQELVEALVYQKDLLVCMGTQLLGQVCALLEQGSQAPDKYSILYYIESDIWEQYMNRLQEYMHVCRWCDVYVYSSCEKERFPFKILGKNALSPQCRVITVSDHGFGGYFPQIIRNRDIFSDFMLRERERLDLNYETFAFSRVDKEIERFCKEKRSVEDIVAQVLDTDFYSREEVKKYFDLEVKRLKTMEASDDIRLGDFIQAHQKECLCRNLNEWNEPVVSYVTDELLERLGLPGVSLNKVERQNLIEQNSGSEILIYPSVQKALGLEEELTNKKYRVTTYYHVRYMLKEEYVRFLAEYLYRAMDLMQLMGADEELQKRINSDKTIA
ncbi:MAG: hypothetical protein J6C84_07855 [Lachnospiraceae bacterium]|nr:hypothetical protein [Lachnospiraceae bacterium]